LDLEFPRDSEEEFKVPLEEFILRACAVYNLWTFIGLSYAQTTDLTFNFFHQLADLYANCSLETDRLYAFPFFSKLWRRRLQRYGPLFERLLTPILEKRKKQWQDGHNETRRDMLTILFNYSDDEQGSLTDTQILHEVFSILQAGGSVATSISDVLKKILSHDKSYVSKVYQEQDQLIQQEGPEITASVLSKMTYFDAII